MPADIARELGRRASHVVLRVSAPRDRVARRGGEMTPLVLTGMRDLASRSDERSRQIERRCTQLREAVAAVRRSA